MELSNEVAAELAGSQDRILRTLEEHLDCDVFLRGNVITLDGDADAVQAGATVVRELSLAWSSAGTTSGRRRSSRSRACSTSASRPPRCSTTSCGATATCA